MENDFYTYLMSLGGGELMVLFALFMLTFLLEDLATSTAALLAAAGEISAPMALLAIILGIILGDFGLYALGKGAKKWHWLSKLERFKSVQKAEGYIGNHVVSSIILARFIPGMRLVTYTAMGFFKVNFKVYSITVIFAVGAWTAILFMLLFSLGQAFAEMFDMYRGVIFFGIFVLGLIIPHFVGKFFKARQARKNA